MINYKKWYLYFDMCFLLKELQNIIIDYIDVPFIWEKNICEGAIIFSKFSIKELLPKNEFKIQILDTNSVSGFNFGISLSKCWFMFYNSIENKFIMPNADYIYLNNPFDKKYYLSLTITNDNKLKFNIDNFIKEITIPTKFYDNSTRELMKNDIYIFIVCENCSAKIIND